MAIDWNSGTEAGSNYATGEEPWNQDNTYDAFQQAGMSGRVALGGGKFLVTTYDQYGRRVQYVEGGTKDAPAASAAAAPSSASGGSSVSGGTSGGSSDGSSWVTGSIFKTGSGSVGSTIDPADVQAQMLAMFQQLTGTAQDQLVRDMSAYRSSESNQLASNYLRETFTEGLSTRMVDQFAGRLRTAQSSRGLAYGGASQQEEAALLTGLQEQQRAALLPELMKKAQFEASAPSEIYKSYMASGAAGIQGAASYGGVLASMFNEDAKPSTTDLLSQLFSNPVSYYGTGVA